MASGGIILGQSGQRILDATGKQLLDNSCFPCCCAPQQYKLVIAGVSFCCPVPNLTGCANPPTVGLCNNVYGPAGSQGSPCPGLGFNGGDSFCDLNYTGTINGTFYLPLVYNNPGVECGYEYDPRPFPVAVTVNSAGCGTPVRTCATFNAGWIRLLFYPPSTAQLYIGLQLAPSPAEPAYSTLIIVLFNAIVTGGVCGNYCNTLAIPNGGCSWDSNLEFVYAGTGGTATATPQ